MYFGISTYLFRHERLCRDHLAHVARLGFAAIELFTSRQHLDVLDPAATAQLGDWVRDSGLTLGGIRTTIAVPTGGPRGSVPLAASAARIASLQGLDEMLAIARTIDVGRLVVDLAIDPTGSDSRTGRRSAVSRTIETVQRMTEPYGVQLAISLGPHDPCTAAGLVQLLDDELDGLGVGACLDFGVAFRQGDLVDAIETLSGHIVTTHVYDTRGRDDERLMPFDGRIDWAAALLALRKVGYDGPLMLEVDAGQGASSLDRAGQAVRDLEPLLRDEWPE